MAVIGQNVAYVGSEARIRRESTKTGQRRSRSGQNDGAMLDL